jgi:hypothetical protein
MTAAEEIAAATATATVMAIATMKRTARTTATTARTKTMMVTTAPAVAAACLPVAAMVKLVIAVLQRWLLGALGIIQMFLGINLSWSKI